MTRSRYEAEQAAGRERAALRGLAHGDFPELVFRFPAAGLGHRAPGDDGGAAGATAAEAAIDGRAEQQQQPPPPPSMSLEGSLQRATEELLVSWGASVATFAAGPSHAHAPPRRHRVEPGRSTPPAVESWV
eukprot:COSAG01_NODE_202_length_22130_cov_167.927239_9_plen_131_part_00